MALDMSDAGGRRTILGFSPFVIALVAVVLIGGGVAFAKTRSDPYVEALDRVCVEQEAYIRALNAENEANFTARLANPDIQNSAVHVVGRSLTRRLAAFRAVAVSPKHASDHAAILAADEQMAATMTAAAQRFEQSPTMRSIGSSMVDTFAENKRQNARLKALGVEHECGF